MKKRQNYFQVHKNKKPKKLKSDYKSMRTILNKNGIKITYPKTIFFNSNKSKQNGIVGFDLGNGTDVQKIVFVFRDQDGKTQILGQQSISSQNNR